MFLSIPERRLRVKRGGQEFIPDHALDVPYTNTIEGVFPSSNVAMTGVYRHCGEAHLHRYLSEFDFCYNRRSSTGFNNTERAEDCSAMHATSVLHIGGLTKPRSLKQSTAALLRKRKKL